MFARVAVVLFCAAVAAASADDFPFKKCSRSDPNFSACLTVAIEESAALMRDGVPSLGIPPLEPLEVDNVIPDHGTNNPRFNLKSLFTDVKIFGLSYSRLNRTALKLEDKFRLKSDIYTERLDFVGDYVMKGQIIFLPIDGRGKANISMHKLTTRHELIGDFYENPDGKTYINVTDYKIKFTPKSVSYKFENLFNGDKVLGETMNNFMNQNWKVVFNGLVPEYARFFCEKFKSISNNVFRNVPMKEIFLE